MHSPAGVHASTGAAASVATHQPILVTLHSGHPSPTSATAVVPPLPQLPSWVGAWVWVCVRVGVCVCGSPQGGSTRRIPQRYPRSPRGVPQGDPRGDPQGDPPMGIPPGDPPRGSPRRIPPGDPPRGSLQGISQQDPPGDPPGNPPGDLPGDPLPPGGVADRTQAFSKFSLKILTLKPCRTVHFGEGIIQNC